MTLTTEEDDYLLDLMRHGEPYRSEHESVDVLVRQLPIDHAVAVALGLCAIRQIDAFGREIDRGRFRYALGHMRMCESARALLTGHLDEVVQTVRAVAGAADMLSTDPDAAIELAQAALRQASGRLLWPSELLRLAKIDQFTPLLQQRGML